MPASQPTKVPGKLRLAQRLRVLAVPLALFCITTTAYAENQTSAPSRAEKALLWESVDPAFQRQLARRLDTLGFGAAVQEKNLAVALVDISVMDEPKVAAVNGDVMLYAASLPKIAILLAAFERIEAGEIPLDDETEELMRRMIQHSSNWAATEMMDRVGKEYIAKVLSSPKYELYDEARNGGLWAGKDYGDAGLWRRDPLHNLSHGATAMQVARFYYLLEKGELVDEEASDEMKGILGESAIDHKFVKALGRIDASAKIFRKSGTWQRWHADSAIVERGGRRYIVVALCEDDDGGRWLERIFHVADALVMDAPIPQMARAAASAKEAPPSPRPESPTVRRGRHEVLRR